MTAIVSKKSKIDFSSFEATSMSSSSSSSSSSTVQPKPWKSWNNLIFACNNLIYLFLDLRERFRLESVNKVCLWELQRTWTILGERNYAFPWREAKNTVNPPKWDCLLTSALTDIVFQMRRGNASIAPRLWSKYQYLIEQFPSFSCYAKMRLVPAGLLDFSQERLKIFAQAKDNPEATSDALLHTLIAMEEIEPHGEPIIPFSILMDNYVEKAVKNGATCISSLVTHTVVWPHDMHEKMAILSAEKRDYRALEKLVEAYSLEELQRLNSANPSLPPVLFRLALHEKDLPKKDVLLRAVIVAYGKRIIPEVLIEAATNKYLLKHYREADEFFTQVIATELDVLPPETLLLASKTKIYLGQWREADGLFTQTIAKYPRGKVPHDVLEEAGVTKCCLNQWREADELLTPAIAIYPGEVSFNTLSLAGQAKIFLGQWREADELFTLAIAIKAKANEKMPLPILSHIVATKLMLLRNQEAYDICALILTEYGIKETPVNILSAAARAKLRLGHYEEADALYHHVWLQCKDLAPGHLLIAIAYTKFRLGQDEEANEFFAQALTKYRQDDHPDHLTQADLPNLPRRKILETEAHELLNQVLTDSANRALSADRAPEAVVALAALLKSHLEQIEKLISEHQLTSLPLARLTI